ncbi:MAG: NAD-dependent epimerase/dehydratase [Microgenomates bacterium 39_7]|nr:MAG: NAD-dependent epimerase/dehydratase [Microgenomates bacterium 39_7]
MQTSYFSNKTVLITGAAGFIGSHLVQRLLSLQAKVIGVDNFITGSAENVEAILKSELADENFIFIKADVNQPPESYLPEKTKIDAVFHLASPASPDRYQENPRETYLVNSWATHQLLDFLLATNPEARFLFASTSEVYGDPEVHPQTEDYWGNVNPNGPRSCYDEAKRLGETICGVHQRDFGMDVRIVRIFNTYGPRMDIDDGRVVPNFIKHALANEKLPVYGDGSQTRSYCFVDDLVEGLLKMISIEDLSGETVNLGNPDEYNVLETAEVIKKIVSGNFSAADDLEYHSLPKDDPTRRKPNITKAKQLLDWQPAVSFEDGLKTTVEYFKNK